MQTFLKKGDQVQAVSDGPVQRYLSQGWEEMTHDEYKKWAEERWQRTKMVHHRNLTQQAEKAEEEGLIKKASDLRKKAARYAPEKKPEPKPEKKTA